eukprot:gene17897-23245_t
MKGNRQNFARGAETEGKIIQICAFGTEDERNPSKNSPTALNLKERMKHFSVDGLHR